jgi:hypothetical protein
MLLGLRSRWTTPAEWTYFRPRYKSISTAGYSCKSEHAYQDLVEEVLDELLLKRSRGEQAVQISTKEFGDEVAVFFVRNASGSGVAQTYISSRGEIKISLREITCGSLAYSNLVRKVENEHSRASGASKASVLGMFSWTKPGC